MAREANSKDPKKPREIIPPPKSFFREKARTPPQLPKAEKVSAAAVIESLKSMGKGWDEEAAGLLRIPPHLFRTGGSGATYYSIDENFGVADVAAGLRYGRVMRSESKYGIAVYDTPGNVYLVLVDMERRIIVRERLMCIHDDPPEKDWANVKNAIRTATAEAARKADTVAVFDGILKSVPFGELGEPHGP
jgi:hypothetical protein